MKKVGFGIIGLGAISKTHSLALEKCEHAYLAAAFDMVEGRAADFCRLHGGRGYDKLEDFLNDPDVEAVIVATPSGLHMDLALSALEKGKNVIVEKPLEITPERCSRMIEKAKEKGVLLSGVFQSRFYDAPRLIKKAIDENRFGKIVMIEASVKWYRSQEYYDSGAWRGTKAIDGGGAFMNQAIHAVDLLSWFGGEVEKIEAMTGTVAHERIEVEDNGAAVLRFKSGAIGVVEASTSIYPGYLKRIEVCGTEGSAILEEESLIEWKFRTETEEDEEIRRRFKAMNVSGGGASDPGAINYQGHMRQFDNFALAVRGESSLEITGEDASRAVGIITGIYRSADKGESVSL